MAANVTRNLDEENITQAVIERFGTAQDPRFREILSKLVEHLHAFARETQLTEDEWFRGIQFLTATGQACTGTRQEFILLSDTLGLSQLVVAQNHKRDERATEQTVFGPFHVENAPQLASGADLGAGLPGDPCFVAARITALDGKPLARATVDVWQADAKGFYDVQDPAWTPDDMKLRARFVTDAEGRFDFRTILPCAYPVPTDGPVGEMLRAAGRHAMRPGHLHFMIDAPGYDRLITHVFTDGDEYLDSDAVFGVRSSCIGRYQHHAAGTTAPDGTRMTVPFYTLDTRFTLQSL